MYILVNTYESFSAKNRKKIVTAVTSSLQKVKDFFEIYCSRHYEIPVKTLIQYLS